MVIILSCNHHIILHFLGTSLSSNVFDLYAVDSLLAGSDSIKCEYVLIKGKRIKNSNLKPPFEFQPCGKNRTCFDTGSVEGPGCYCPKGYLLNPETQLCEEPSERCPGGEPDIDLNLSEL